MLHSLARTYGGSPASYYDPELPPLAAWEINHQALRAGVEEERRVQEERAREAEWRAKQAASRRF